MATTTHAIGTADTGASPNTSGAFTPAANDLLVVFVVASDTTDAAGTLSCSAGTTFTLVNKAVYSASANAIYCFVANSLSAASSQTVTWTETSDAASGTHIFVERIAGMSRTGSGAIRQSAKTDNGSAAGTPAATFASSALTGNVTLGVVGNSSNPAAMTPPTNWTEPASTGDLGYNVPATGGEVVFRDSGFTSTTITWGGTSATVYGVSIVELDTTSVVPRGNTIVAAPKDGGNFREAFGYALLFGASTALFSVAPPPVQPPNKTIVVREQEYRNLDAYVHGTATPATSTDVGGPNYYYGDNNRIVADSQPKPRVWGFTPSVVAVDTAIAETRVVNQEVYTDIPAYVHGTAPASVPRPLLRAIVSAPPQTDEAYGLVWGPQPSGIDKPPPKTLFSAPEQLGISYARTWGPTPAPIVSTDSPVGKWFTAAPQNDPTQYSLVWGTKQAYVVNPSPKTMVVAPEQVGLSYAKLWNSFPPGVPLTKFLTAFPQEDQTQYSLVWGLTPPPVVSVDNPVGKWFVSAPEQLGLSYGKLWGPFPPPVAAVGSPFGRFIISAPEQISDAYANLWGLPPESVVALPVIAEPADQPTGGWISRAYERKLYLDKELQEDQEREELAERLESVLVDSGSLAQEQADLIRLRGLADEYGDELSNRARRALAFAERAQTQMAVNLALREMERLRQEEDLAILLILTLD